MKTLLFCTSYTESKNDWDIKYKYWLNHHKNIGISFDKSLIVDDGSPHLPTESELSNTTIWYDNIDYTDEASTNNIIYHHNDRLGRIAIWNYPGWYRSFSYAIKYAHKFDYDKVIHIESDAYIISNKLINYINNITDKWITLWTPKYHIAETAIQVIAGRDNISDALNIFTKPYSEYANRSADTSREVDSWLNYTIDRSFKGDRWGDSCSIIPDDADYTCQINIKEYLSLNMVWFLNSNTYDSNNL